MKPVNAITEETYLEDHQNELAHEAVRLGRSVQKAGKVRRLYSMWHAMCLCKSMTADEAWDTARYYKGLMLGPEIGQTKQS